MFLIANHGETLYNSSYCLTPLFCSPIYPSLFPPLSPLLFSIPPSLSIPHPSLYPPPSLYFPSFYQVALFFSISPPSSYHPSLSLFPLPLSIPPPSLLRRPVLRRSRPVSLIKVDVDDNGSIRTWQLDCIFIAALWSPECVITLAR